MAGLAGANAGELRLFAAELQLELQKGSRHQT